MTSKPFAVPLRPDFAAVRHRGATAVVRAATALLLGHVNQQHVQEVLRANWPDDRAAEWLTKAAVLPAQESVAGWAGSLVGLGVADFISLLSPAFASAALLARGIQLQFVGTNRIKLPSFVSDPAYATFIAEAQPFPVLAFDASGGVTLSAKKFGTLTAFTREILEHSVPSVEAIVRQVLSESIGRGLDKFLFDAVAATSVRPAGMLAGVAAIAPAAAASTVQATVFNDVQKLAASVAAVADGASIILIASPAQAILLRLYLPFSAGFEVLSSAALSAGVVVALASNCLVSAVDPTPRFEVGRDAVLHMEDTTPLAISTVGSPNVVAAPIRSMFQTDSVALRTIMQISWALRAPAGICWTTVSW